MENILIIGAGDFQLPLVQRASRSYNVLLAAPVISDAFGPYITDSLLIDVRDKDRILEFARERSICGVITDIREKCWGRGKRGQEQNRI